MMKLIRDFVDDLFWKKIRFFYKGQIVFRIYKPWADYDYISYEVEDINGPEITLVKTEDRTEKVKIKKKDLITKVINNKEVLVFSL